MSTIKRPYRAKPPSLPGGETWTYHDVPPSEVEEARAQETIVVAACGYSFYPEPIPEKLRVVDNDTELEIKLAPAVQLIRCKVCAEINHDHFGDRPAYDDSEC